MHHNPCYAIIYSDYSFIRQLVLGELVAHAEEGSDMAVNSYSFMGTTTLELSVCGEAMDIQETFAPSVPDIWAAPDTKVSEDLRQIILNNMSQQVKYKHKDSTKGTISPSLLQLLCPKVFSPFP